MDKTCIVYGCCNTKEIYNPNPFLRDSKLNKAFCGTHVRERLIETKRKKQKNLCSISNEPLGDEIVLKMVIPKEHGGLNVINNFTLIRIENSDVFKKLIEAKNNKLKRIKPVNPKLKKNNFKNTVKNQIKVTPSLIEDGKKSKKLKLLVMQMNLCAICFKPFTLEDGPTKDHIVPKSKGGPDTIDNIQLVHSKCNSLKADKDMKVFMKEYMNKKVNYICQYNK